MALVQFLERDAGRTLPVTTLTRRNSRVSLENMEYFCVLQKIRSNGAVCSATVILKCKNLLTLFLNTFTMTLVYTKIYVFFYLIIAYFH